MATLITYFVQGIDGYRCGHYHGSPEDAQRCLRAAEGIITCGHCAHVRACENDHERRLNTKELDRLWSMD